MDDDKQQQICALGRLGWTLSRIEEATGVRRETVSGYLRAAGIAVRGRGRPSEATAKPAISGEVSTDSRPAKPAISARRCPPTRVRHTPGRAPSASACEPYRELIAEALGAWAQRRRDLAGPRRRPRLSPRGTRVSVASSSQLRGTRAGGGARRHHDGARRRRPGRLRRGPDGARSAARASTGARGSSS